MSERCLLLDTCALIWLAIDAPELSGRSRTAIDEADMVCVSAISAWEISLKVARNALDLPLQPAEWFGRVLDHHHLNLAALSVDILVAANTLPWHHRDPADRFIDSHGWGSQCSRGYDRSFASQLYDIDVFT